VPFDIDGPPVTAPSTLPRLLYSRAEASFRLSISTRGIGGRILIPHEELHRFAGSDRKQVITPGTTESQIASAA
jgi:hypothetical protein